MLLAELLGKLLYLPALLDTVPLGVVHQAPVTTLVAAEWLMWAFVTAWATARTCHCCCCGGSSSQWLVLVISLLLLLVAALSSGICIGLAGFPCLWGRL
jgi:hypothetical protein